MARSVSVQFVGSGDAFGSGGRLQTCIHVGGPSRNYLLDCGCSSLIGLQRCNIAPESIDTIIVTHLHGDHFGGIPFLLLEAKHVSKRRRPLTLIGPSGLQQQVEQAIEALYPGAIGNGVEFPLHYLELTAERPVREGSLEVRGWPMRHGSSDQVFGLRVACDGRQIVYTGDTEWTDNLIPLCEGADLVICECFQYDQPIPSHLDYRTLMGHRQQLNCKRLILTHPGEGMLARLDQVELEMAADGLKLQL